MTARRGDDPPTDTVGLRGSSRLTSPGFRVPRLAVAVLVPSLLLAACAGPERVESPATCQAPAEATELDTDMDDTPEAPWRKPDGKELLVYFETDELSDRYAGMVFEASAIWSRSPCLNAVAVPECPNGGNCVTVEEEFSGERRTDGEFTGMDRNGVREGGRIILYTRLLDRTSDNGALATTAHEMGHALGLMHRLDRSSLMHASTNTNTDPVPDDTDFFNLAVIYGTGS